LKRIGADNLRANFALDIGCEFRFPSCSRTDDKERSPHLTRPNVAFSWFSKNKIGKVLTARAAGQDAVASARRAARRLSRKLRLKAADGVCCNFLRVHHRDLIERVEQGGTDEEILQWCFEKGRRLNAGDLFVWNGICIEARLARFDHAMSRRTKKTNENRRSRRHSFQTSSISTRADSRKRARLREFIELRLAASRRRSDWSLLSGFQLLQLRRPNHIGSDPKGAGATAWRLDVG